jgi:hypothetical protein
MCSGCSGRATSMWRTFMRRTKHIATQPSRRHALDAFGIRIAETPISPARIVELMNSASSAATTPLAGMRELISHVSPSPLNPLGVKGSGNAA